MDNQKEYIICAAIKRKEPRKYHICYHEHLHDIFNIEIGYRHCDIISRFTNEVSSNPKDQGFYTSKGRFVSRKEALEIAKTAGQVNELIGGMLTSEDLY